MSKKKFVFNWQIYFGIMLLVTGGLFLADLYIPGLDLMINYWPLLVVFFGLTFFIGMLVAGKKGSGLAIPGSVIMTIGGLLFLQNAIENMWVTWTYAWGLVVAAVGIGMLIMNFYLKRVALRRVAGLLIGIGLVSFVIMGVFFRIILGLGNEEIGGLFLGGGVLLLGIFVIFSRPLFRKEKAPRPAKTETVDVPAADMPAAEPVRVEEPVEVEESQAEVPAPSPLSDDSAGAASSEEVQMPQVGQVISLEQDFTGVRFKSFGEIVLLQGDTCSLRIDAEEKHIGNLEINIQEGILNITYKSDLVDWTELSWTKKHDAPRYFVTLSAVDLIEMAGAGNLLVHELKGESLILRHAGAGQVELEQVELTSLTVDLGGLGEIIIHGAVQNQTVDISGVGAYQAVDLKSDICDVILSGGGAATVWAEKNLNANITGAGSIKYKGSPVVQESNTGLGSVKPL